MNKIVPFYLISVTGLVSCSSPSGNINRTELPNIVVFLTDDQGYGDFSITGNTIVLFFNDNGPNGHRWNDGMKGTKGSTDEGGVRSPLFIRWPEKIPSGRMVSEIAGAIDLLPTLAELAGISVETKHPLDGISVKPLIVGEQDKMNDRVIFAHWNGRVSARNQQYRFNHNNELYHVNTDPRQLRDISGENPVLTMWFKKQVEEWTREVTRNLSETKRNFPAGHPEFKFTQLPARDGTAHGGIVRSNRFPNSSFFTNWKLLSDKITWPIEVIEDGEFEVDIYYTCPHGDEGSEIKLSFRNNTLITRIKEPHDPPLIGMENDRVERWESYEKDFKLLMAGVIRLEKGEGELTLQALNIPGNEVMDFRKLMLTRIK